MGFESSFSRISICACVYLFTTLPQALLYGRQSDLGKVLVLARDALVRARRFGASPQPLAVSYSFFGDRAPFLQHAAISASMAIVRPLDSLADVDMVDVAWVSFVPRPSAMSTAPSTVRYSRPRARTAKLGSDVERVQG